MDPVFGNVISGALEDILDVCTRRYGSTDNGSLDEVHHKNSNNNRAMGLAQLKGIIDVPNNPAQSGCYIIGALRSAWFNVYIVGVKIRLGPMVTLQEHNILIGPMAIFQ